TDSSDSFKRSTSASPRTPAGAAANNANAAPNVTPPLPTGAAAVIIPDDSRIDHAAHRALLRNELLQAKIDDIKV
ncbi:unnamed protein product, partial [Gongylonema pulchrum]|uniref:Reverse transcriptase domain-containing protein n=1 Tax=Gongylonema pulchrum TaxID=637853 RepID=A0A183DHH5_9BILA